MTENNNSRSRRSKKSDKTSRRNKKSDKKSNRIGIKIFKFALLTILLVAFISAGAVTGLVIAIAKDAPKIDTSTIISSLAETSVIVDESGNLIERIHTKEYRQVVSIDKIPEHVQKAFIAIEDERFETHKGIDIKRIFGALIADIKAGAPVQGASTITQQLAKNMYLLEEIDRQNLMNDVSRKIKEAYLALQIDRELTKDQILEAYLNRINLGQGAYGVQAAAKTYFSKDVSDLTIAEAAMIAGITKNPSKYPLFRTVSPNSVTENSEDVIGEAFIDGQKLVMIHNDTEKVINRKNTVLSKMRELNYITEEEYQEAINVDIRTVLNPTRKEQEDISSYFGDYVKKQVINALIEEKGFSKEKASELLYNGGLEIVATIDSDLQGRIEDVFNNFDQILVRYNPDGSIRFVEESSLKSGNLVDKYGNVIFYKKDTLLSDKGYLIIDKGTYSFTNDGDLIIENKKLNIYPKTVDIDDYYTVSANNDLLSYKMGSLSLTLDDYTKAEKSPKSITIKSSYLKKNKDFYTIDSNKNLLIHPRYFLNYGRGVLQPQSAVVIMDYRTGKIKALIGGRDIEERRMSLNRATDIDRQPGSAIKPLSVYMPALDSGQYTASSIIDDIIHYDSAGNRWPKNWYEGYNKFPYAYRGLTTLRKSVEQSVNVNAVKVLENIGIDTSLEYLKNMGLGDALITRDENSRTNDENYAALALGGMSKGVSPLEMTAAYGVIPNQGIYTEAIAFTKILDRDGNVIYENKSTKHRVVSPQVAYLMSDILESTVTSGLGRRAMISELLFNSKKNDQIPVAGKTGTTQGKADAWFVGYTPYYTASVWIGNDSNLTLPDGSSMSAMLWAEILAEAHKGFEPKDFEAVDGFVTKNICIDSGKLAISGLCDRDIRGNRIRSEIFIKGTEPKEFCDVHVEVTVDKNTGLLATEYCPPELVENRVYIKRTVPYDPWDPELMAFIENSLKEEENKESQGKIFLLPKDYQYNAPVDYCTEHTEPPQPDPTNFWDIFFGNDKDDQTDENQDNTDGNGENTNQQDDGVEIIDSNDGNENNSSENSNNENDSAE